MDALSELRKRRVALGIPLHDAARAVGRSDATISRVERGRIRASFELVQKLRDYLEHEEEARAPRLTVGDVMHTPLVTVHASDLLSAAAQTLRAHGYSQVPVVDDGRVVGSLSESVALRAIAEAPGRKLKVGTLVQPAYPIVDLAFPAELASGLLGRYPALLVARSGEPEGIVTKADLIRGLRGTSLRRSGPS